MKLICLLILISLSSCETELQEQPKWNEELVHFIPDVLEHCSIGHTVSNLISFISSLRFSILNCSDICLNTSKKNIWFLLRVCWLINSDNTFNVGIKDGFWGLCFGQLKRKSLNNHVWSHDLHFMFPSRIKNTLSPQTTWVQGYSCLLFEHSSTGHLDEKTISFTFIRLFKQSINSSAKLSISFEGGYWEIASNAWGIWKFDAGKEEQDSHFSL